MEKDLISMADLSAADIACVLDEARALKKTRAQRDDLRGKTLGLIFQKPSTRTAVSFSVAMAELGGFPLTLDGQNLQIKRGETMADTARTLSRYLAGIMIRANRQDDVEELAKHASIPVINGLTEKEHPCQVLADLQTILETFKMKDARELKGFPVAYVGDGNNMTHSWMLAAGLLGMKLSVSCPEGYDPTRDYVEKAEGLCRASGGSITYNRDPKAASADVAVIYTDVWISMGQEAEADRRREVFTPYQVNASLLGVARKDAVVMHCLPAHRGEEISAEALDGPRSVVFDQAENRLHVQKAVLLHCMGKK
jgi:ornithine carbamoyltransferase